VYNHEMSWLAFNWRVLAMAMDPASPLFERLRFVAIAARNLDEFFAKRVGALKRQEAAGVENLLKKRDKSIWTPGEQLRLISRAVQEMDETIAQTLLGDVLPKLRQAGVFLLDYDELTEQARWRCLARAHERRARAFLHPLGRRRCRKHIPFVCPGFAHNTPADSPSPAHPSRSLPRRSAPSCATGSWRRLSRC
jgi:polyphosphate kinase